MSAIKLRINKVETTPTNLNNTKISIANNGNNIIKILKISDKSNSNNNSNINNSNKDRKSTRLNSSHIQKSRMPSSA